MSIYNCVPIFKGYFPCLPAIQCVLQSLSGIGKGLNIVGQASLPSEQNRPFFMAALSCSLATVRMAMGNLNKSKETTPTTTTALKVAP